MNGTNPRSNSKSPIGVEKRHLVGAGDWIVTKSGNGSPVSYSAVAAPLPTPCVGEPADAADRCRAPLGEAVDAALLDARQLRPDDGDRRRLGVKEPLRLLLAERKPSKIRWRLADFYDAAMPRTTRLATTIQARRQPSSSRSSTTSPTPAPRASTGSSNKPS